jgi:hypothetical protein
MHRQFTPFQAELQYMRHRVRLALFYSGGFFMKKSKSISGVCSANSQAKRLRLLAGMAALLLAFGLVLTGCDGGGGASPTVSTVTVRPVTASVAKGGTQQFSAEAAGINSPAQTVTWTEAADPRSALLS